METLEAKTADLYGEIHAIVDSLYIAKQFRATAPIP